MPNGQGKHVDDLVHVRAHQMGAHDEVSCIIDQDLVAIDRFCLLSGRKPGGGLLGLSPNLQPFLPGLGFSETHCRNGRNGEGNAGDTLVIGFLMVSLE